MNSVSGVILPASHCEPYRFGLTYIFRKKRRGLIMVGLNFVFALAEVMMNFNIIASILNLCDDIDRIKARQKLEYLSRLNPVFYVMV